jgi:hypothetical protein
MTPSQTAELLTFCAAFDRRTIGKADVLAWHAVLGDIDPDEARNAVTAHYRDQTRWIMPAEANPPDGDTGDQAYQAALLAERRAIASGTTRPHGVPALPAGTSDQPTGRARAILASVGDRIPTTRAGVVNVLGVPCPRCHATPGRVCTTAGRKRADAHPARLEDAHRHAAGLPPADPAEADRELQRRREASRAAIPPGVTVEPQDGFQHPNHQEATAS